MKRVMVAYEYHLQRTPDNRYWSNGVINADIFHRYTKVFDEVIVAARIDQVSKKGMDFVNRCDGEKIFFLALPEFSGVEEGIRCYFKAKRIIKKALDNVDCLIVRAPNAVSFQVLEANRGKLPYALEIAADPWTFYSKESMDVRFRPLIRLGWTGALQYYARHANGVSYVTERYLQKRYPCKAMRKAYDKKYFMERYSSVELLDDDIMEPKSYESHNTYHLIHISNAINRHGKGHIEAIRVIALLNKKGLDVTINFVGDGNLVDELKEYAVHLGISDKVFFEGRIAKRDDVLKRLRESDLFLFPSHSEGLPRVVIESMAVGTPCVATRVGGIPELLDKECICDVGDVEAMFRIVIDILTDEKRMTALSRKCVRRAARFKANVLEKRRTHFYEMLREIC